MKRSHTQDSSKAGQKEALLYIENQRNYYRLMHVQPDAVDQVIEVAYRACSERASKEYKLLLDEAFSIIGKKEFRLIYDTLLRLYTHRESIERLRRVMCTAKSDITISNMMPIHPSADNKAKSEITPHQAKLKPTHCIFCGAISTRGSSGFVDHLAHSCSICHSPLSLPADVFINQSRRSLMRINQATTVHIYQSWPSNPAPVLLENLSPIGLSYLASQEYKVEQIIKIDARHFKAVAKVVHCREVESKEYRTGARFLTIEFARTTGSFLSAVA